jgi:RNA polymerase sigma factor (TIGR02999 family)
MTDPIPSPEEITQILHSWRHGSREALERLIPLVHRELSALASRQLAREWRHGRLQTTSVVNEAYMKLFDQRDVDWQNRGHFFAIAAQVMRRIWSITRAAICARSGRRRRPRRARKR